MLLDLRGHHFSGSRAFASGKLYSRDGKHLATVAQEGLFRPR
jgi:acyl-CoA thioesterase